ncbi:MmgE/PrpD family protein [Gordonia sp. TBRC 11910]|uniref:MmgE/PrpD family protein n=1 Tax=Gordonia asplenii TaxID=2725283 RepID=A0A848KNT1_9ACTN|nr:MmgE/PrpD family protein [Gordonia asplenii]NMO00704.1 MmgE/PrpD family protein [Gordonia asplenii]
MSLFEIHDDEDPMAPLCRMALQTTFADLPPQVVEHATHSLLDGMAVTIGGSGMDGIPGLVELITERGGAPQSVLPFYGGRFPANEVALAIGPMPRAMDCGDLHEDAGHVGEYIVASLLAATGLVNGAVSGEDFLTALVVGQEILIRIGAAYHVISKAIPEGDCGGHYIFGAVAAVGRLIGLDQDQLENAQGIARTMTQPHTMGIYSPATLMVRTHHGVVCQAAINACELARKGITGPRDSVLTGPNGLFRTARWETHPETITEGLGDVWLSTRLTTKGYSACYFNHSSVDAIIEQMVEHGFSARDIAAIAIEVSPSGWGAVCEPIEKKWNPVTIPDCQFSLPYAVAVAAFDRRLFVDSYGDDQRRRPEVRELMTRITASMNPDVSDWGARMTTTLRDGRVVHSECIHVKGHPDKPFTRADFVDKFYNCVPFSIIPIPQDVQAQLVDDVLHLDRCNDVVAALLTPLLPHDELVDA